MCLCVGGEYLEATSSSGHCLALDVYKITPEMKWQLVPHGATKHCSRTHRHIRQHEMSAVGKMLTQTLLLSFELLSCALNWSGDKVRQLHLPVDPWYLDPFSRLFSSHRFLSCYVLPHPLLPWLYSGNKGQNFHVPVLKISTLINIRSTADPLWAPLSLRLKTN